MGIFIGCSPYSAKKIGTAGSRKPITDQVRIEIFTKKGQNSIRQILNSFTVSHTVATPSTQKTNDPM